MYVEYTIGKSYHCMWHGRVKAPHFRKKGCWVWICATTSLPNRGSETGEGANQ